MKVGDLIISKDKLSYYSSPKNIRRLGVIIKINNYEIDRQPTTYTCWLGEFGVLELHPNQVELITEEEC